MKIYAASIVIVLDSTGKIDSYPLLISLNSYSSCEDFFIRAVEPSVKERSKDRGVQSYQAFISIVEGVIQENGSLTKTDNFNRNIAFKSDR